MLKQLEEREFNSENQLVAYIDKRGVGELYCFLCEKKPMDYLIDYEEYSESFVVICIPCANLKSKKDAQYIKELGIH